MRMSGSLVQQIGTNPYEFDSNPIRLWSKNRTPIPGKKSANPSQGMVLEWKEYQTGAQVMD